MGEYISLIINPIFVDIYNIYNSKYRMTWLWYPYMDVVIHVISPMGIR